ncbi:Ropporin-1-like protein [Eumeta japonica]|uniref:Ropporin-1-like protein n=1 Tax=Eumeta variegata TaxID=151549 RepID=A0A4C1U353_EUMVA|nr:Ropporin-1-like protein [Eumeta japonica]
MVDARATGSRAETDSIVQTRCSPDSGLKDGSLFQRNARTPRATVLLPANHRTGEISLHTQEICKSGARHFAAAIKTQPYDLLRWSYEYFRAVAEGRPPPVKLRLEYPVYSTEGGLTRGYLKVLANQLAGFDEVPISKLQEIWEGSCLDVEEFKRILCLADAFMRSETVSRLKFLAIAAGLLTKRSHRCFVGLLVKNRTSGGGCRGPMEEIWYNEEGSLTHTMILLCETLTGGPEGGSAAVPVDIFLEMYKCLAYIDASKEVTYYNGWREGLLPVETPPLEEEEGEGEKSATTIGTPSSTTDDFWEEIEEEGLTKIHLTDERVAKSNKISMKLEEPVIGRISRTPSVERDAQREMENILKECRGYVVLDSLKYLLVSLKKKLRQMSTDLLGDTAEEEQEVEPQTVVRNDDVELHVYDEDCNQCQLEFYGGATAATTDDVTVRQLASVT